MQEGLDICESYAVEDQEATPLLSVYEIEKLELAADALEALATTSWGTRQRVFRRMLGLGRFKNPDPELQVEMQYKLSSATDLIRGKVLGTEE